MSIVNRDITYECDECGEEQTKNRNDGLPYKWLDIFYTRNTEIAELTCHAHICERCVISILTRYFHNKFN